MLTVKVHNICTGICTLCGVNGEFIVIFKAINNCKLGLSRLLLEQNYVYNIRVYKEWRDSSNFILLKVDYVK